MNQTNTLRFLVELRRRLIVSIFALFIFFLVTCCFSNTLYHWLALPLLKQLSNNQHLIATNMVSAFFTPLEFAFYVAVYMTIPVFFYQIWAYVAPALYPSERRAVWPLIMASILLFYLGLLFAYKIIFPIIFSFLAHTAPLGIQLMPDIAQYLDFTLQLFLVFGVIFEIPVVVIFLAKMKIVSREKLIHFRPYVIVGSFVIGMLFAPPDVLSQTLVALPVWGLYEAGVFLLKFYRI